MSIITYFFQGLCWRKSSGEISAVVRLRSCLCRTVLQDIRSLPFKTLLKEILVKTCFPFVSLFFKNWKALSKPRCDDKIHLRIVRELSFCFSVVYQSAGMSYLSQFIWYFLFQSWSLVSSLQSLCGSNCPKQGTEVSVIKTSDRTAEAAARHQYLGLNQNGFDGRAIEFHSYISYHILVKTIWALQILHLLNSIWSLLVITRDGQ